MRAHRGAYRHSHGIGLSGMNMINGRTSQSAYDVKRGGSLETRAALLCHRISRAWSNWSSTATRQNWSSTAARTARLARVVLATHQTYDRYYFRPLMRRRLAVDVHKAHKCALLNIVRRRLFRAHRFSAPLVCSVGQHTQFESKLHDCNLKFWLAACRLRFLAIFSSRQKDA